MMLHKSIISVILSLLPWLCHGQAYDLEYYKATNGLSSNNATCVIVDKDEFVWIGTRTGLNRYDGTRFKIFMHNAAQSYSIGSDNITMLYEGNDGSLWIVHDRGLSKWDKHNHHFQNLLYEEWQMPPGTYISRIMDYDATHLFVATTNGLLLIHKGNFKITKIPLPYDNKLSAYIHNRQIWYLYNNRLNVYDIDTKKSMTISQSNLDQAVAAYISHYDEVKDALYISTYNNGCYVFYTASNRWQNVKYDHTIVNYDPMYSMKNVPGLGTVFNTDYTLGLLDDSNNTKPLAAVKNLTNATIRDFAYQDNNLWIATSQGLVHAKKPKINIQVKAKYPFVKDRYATVRYDEKADLLYTSNYDYPYIYTIDGDDQYHLLPMQNGYVKGGLRNVYRDRHDRLWLSTESEIFMRNPHEQYWKNIKIDKDALPRNFIEDNAGRLFLRIRNKGIYQWDDATNAFQAFFNTSQMQETYTGMAYVSGIDKLLVSTKLQSLISVDPHNKKMEALNFKNTKPCKYLDHITVSNDNTLWLSDAIDGIYKCNIYTLTAKHFTTSDGMLSNNNEAMVLDKNGHIWTFSSEGVNVIKTDGSIQSVTNEALVKLHDIAYANGKVYVINDKIYWWKTDSIGTSEKKPVLYKDYMVVNNKHVAWPQNEKFDYDENAISLYFGIRSYSLKTLPNFQYKFKDEDGWHDLQQSNAISFSKLAPGDYNLQVRVENEEDKSKWISAQWIIKKPFWQEYYFLACLALLVSAITYFFWKKSIGEVKRAAQLKQKIAELKTSALRAQMNPHFIFNCLSGIDNFILQNREVDASNYLNKFSKLLRAVLESSKSEIIPFQQDWQTLLLYIELEQMRSGHSFAVDAKADEALINGHYKIPPMIVQPYLENAIQHGMRKVNNGVLVLHAALNDGSLIYTIEDNGPGIPQNIEVNKKHKSYGMDISKERIELFNASENVENITILSPCNPSLGIGTKVTVTLKI